MRTKLETMVGIRFDIEGMHSYPDAARNHGEGVRFLEFPHRHRFFFNCKKRVNHDNRDEEFILLKNRVESYIKLNTPIIGGTAIYDFGNQSCEQIAKKVLKQFDFEEVEVSEDGENYAVVKKVPEDGENEQKGNFSPKQSAKITFVVGGCCSGKTYIAKALSKKMMNEGKKTYILEVGDIVRLLTNKQERVFDKNFHKKITEILCNSIQIAFKQDYENVIVVGCRQIEVFKETISSLDQKNYDIVYIAAPKDIRKARYENRCSSKDSKSFEEVLNGEKSIGFNDFIEYLVNEEYEKLTIVNNI